MYQIGLQLALAPAERIMAYDLRRVIRSSEVPTCIIMVCSSTVFSSPLRATSILLRYQSASSTQLIQHVRRFCHVEPLSPLAILYIHSS
jgi:hypothetical protein